MEKKLRYTPFQGGQDLNQPTTARCDSSSRSPENRYSFWTIALMVAATSCFTSSPTSADLAGDVAAMTGARTKIVWVHLASTGIGKGKSWDAVAAEYELMAFDTADGKTRVLLPGPASYANPCIAPDGETVFYTDHPANTIYRVKWDGSDKKAVTQGYILSAWKNPTNNTAWIYFTEGGYSKGALLRCRIDDPTIREVVWTKDQADHTLTLSADGTHAGSGFPWPLAGVALLPNVYWRQYGNGCNAGIAPDNSYRLMHMGEKAEHNGVMMYDDGGLNKRMIPFTGMPGRRPQDDSWIPRWSSDVRFFTLNSPIGGELADIYLGQFDENFTKVIQWIRISDQPGQDTKACCWIAPGLGRYDGEAPYAIEVPADLTPGGDWTWDYGDGVQEKAAKGKHTYQKPGFYIMSAQKGDTVIKGWARIREQKAPSVADVRLFDETHLVVAFDERVQLKDAKVALSSGAPVKEFALDPEGLRLSVELAGHIDPKDTLKLEGVLDRAQVPNALKTTKIAVTRPAWPANRTRLVFLWETNQKKNFGYHAPSQSFMDTRFVTLKKARPDRDGALQLDGGVVSFIDAASGLVSESARTNQLSIEATITPANLYQGYPGDPRRIVACRTEEGGFESIIFALCQEGNKLVFLLRVRTPQDKDSWGSIQQVELCTLAAAPNHVVVTYNPGRLACYLNGKLVKETDEVKGILHGGKPAFNGGLYFGGTDRAVYPWRGKVEGLAVYSRILEPAEVAANCATYSTMLAKRKVVPPVEIEAKLVAMSEIPRAAEIAPYRDALIVNEYEVVKVLQGKNPGKKLRVSQWGLVETEPTSLARAKPGDVMRFAVEPLADHTELEAEVTRDTLPEDFEAPRFLDVTLQPSGAPRVDKILVHPGEIWMPTGEKVQFRTDMLDQYGNPFTGPLKWSATPGGSIDLGTAYGAGNYFEERSQPGEGQLDANGLFVAEGKPGCLVVTAASPEDPLVKGSAVVGFGHFPALNPAGRVPMRFGLSTYGDNLAFSGDIDRVRVYSRVLTGDEIAGHAEGKGLDAQDAALVGDWTFDETKDGVYPNIITTGLTAKVVGEVQPVDDKDGRYVRFNGKGYLEVAPDPRLDYSKALTVEAWIHPKSAGCIVSKEIVWSWGYQLTLQDGQAMIDTLRVDTGPIGGPYAPSGDGWQHVVGVLHGFGGQRVYLNGKLIAERNAHSAVLRE